MAQTLERIVMAMGGDPNNEADRNAALEMLQREERDSMQAAPQQEATPARDPRLQAMEVVEGDPPPADTPEVTPMSSYQEEMTAAQERAAEMLQRIEAARAQQKDSKLAKFMQGFGALGDVLGSGGTRSSDRYTRARQAELAGMDAAEQRIRGEYGLEDEQIERQQKLTDREDTLGQRDVTRKEEAYQREQTAKLRDAQSPESQMVREQLKILAQQDPLARQILATLPLDSMSAEQLLNYGGKISELTEKAIAHQRASDLQSQKDRAAMERTQAQIQAKPAPQTPQSKLDAKREEKRQEYFLNLEEAAAPGGALERELANIDKMMRLLIGEGTQEDLQGLGTGPMEQWMPWNWESVNDKAMAFKKASEQLVLDATSQLTGVLTDKDMDVLRDTVANMGTDEEENMRLLQQARSLIAGKVDEYHRLAKQYGSQEGGLREGVPLAPGTPTIERRAPDGRIVLYDANTKQPIGYKDELQ